MCGNRGFTLLELLVALVVLAVGFSVVLEVLSFARLEYSSAYELSGDIIKGLKAQELKLEELSLDLKGRVFTAKGRAMGLNLVGDGQIVF